MGRQIEVFAEVDSVVYAEVDSVRKRWKEDLRKSRSFPFVALRVRMTRG
jgi:hypothetical protein